MTSATQPVDPGGLSAAGAVKGTERWAVKTGIDDGAAKIDIHAAQPTTVAEMCGQGVPKAISADPFYPDRVGPVETTVWTIDATLTAYGLESDGDYHLVLSDGSRTMIAEIPDPALFDKSKAPHQELLMMEARGAFTSQFPAQLAALARFMTEFAAIPVDGPGSLVPMIKRVSVGVRVSGIGFFDRVHGQLGVAPNGIELHPVLAIAFPTAGAGS